MTTLDQRLAELRAHTAHLNYYLMLLEKVAADLIEDAHAAGDAEIEHNAVLYQRATHIAYDTLNLDPDAIDRIIDAPPTMDLDDYIGEIMRRGFAKNDDVTPSA